MVHLLAGMLFLRWDNTVLGQSFEDWDPFDLYTLVEDLLARLEPRELLDRRQRRVRAFCSAFWSTNHRVSTTATRSFRNQYKTLVQAVVFLNHLISPQAMLYPSSLR